MSKPKPSPTTTCQLGPYRWSSTSLIAWAHWWGGGWHEGRLGVVFFDYLQCFSPFRCWPHSSRRRSCRCPSHPEPYFSNKLQLVQKSDNPKFSPFNTEPVLHLCHLSLHIRVLQHGVAARKNIKLISTTELFWDPPVENHLGQTFLLVVHRHPQVRRQHLVQEMILDQQDYSVLLEFCRLAHWVLSCYESEGLGQLVSSRCYSGRKTLPPARNQPLWLLHHAVKGKCRSQGKAYFGCFRIGRSNYHTLLGKGSSAL